jgi:hypothetical protein
MEPKPYRVGRSRTRLGLFATMPIKKHTLIVEYSGPRIATAQAHARERAGRSKYRFGNIERCASHTRHVKEMGEPDGSGPRSPWVHRRTPGGLSYRILSPNFFNAAAAGVKPKPGALFNVTHPFAIFGGFSNNSACRGSRSGSVNDSTMQPAGVEATSGAWMKQS